MLNVLVVRTTILGTEIKRLTKKKLCVPREDDREVEVCEEVQEDVTRAIVEKFLHTKRRATKELPRSEARKGHDTSTWAKRLPVLNNNA